jgi:hypothetical protein
MDINSLLERVKQAIFNDPTTPHQPGHDPSGLIGQIESLFGQHRAQTTRDGYVDPNGAYADYPSGAANDPRFRNVRPASEDPLGDPADMPSGGTSQYRNIRPASEDPLGDPADDEYRRR